MQLDLPSNVDTAAMGRLLLRLRDQIDQINASLDQPDPIAQREAVERAREMLSKESQNVASLQDSVLRYFMFELRLTLAVRIRKIFSTLEFEKTLENSN